MVERYFRSSTGCVVKYVTNPSVSDILPVAGEKKTQLLALRGLLAYGIFESCLAVFHEVNYGVDERRGVKHRAAVPYRTSDTPSERTKYKHPEMFLLRTVLSYYHRGISPSENKEVVKVLLSLGSKVQIAEYDNLWLKSARPTMTTEQLSAIDSVDKLDVESTIQLELLHEVFRYNMAAIDFWLNNCVFPTETRQFPQSLIANAFHLADNSKGRIIGFSGTKDNHLLLPHQAEQSKQNDVELTATDGKMLDLLGPKNDEAVEIIDDSIDLRSGVLQLVERGYHALIDAGGTMAGLSNREVANRILDILSRHRSSLNLKGVVYFDVDHNTWYVLDRRGRCLPKGSSPIHESEAFVFFDESRCRGADMKLSPDAKAILTIGPSMCKDKLIQAAGRMRRLMFGQKISMAVPPELVIKIRLVNGGNVGIATTPIHILNWVLKNTNAAVEEGLPEWGAQGIYFASTVNNPDARLVEEHLDLETMYGPRIEEQTIDKALHDRYERELHRIGEKGEVDSEALRTILGRLKRFGSDVKTKSTGSEEECERELENERELEQELEREIPRQKPALPRQWDFDTIISADTFDDLDPAAGVLPLREVCRSRLHSCLSSIQWDLGRLFATDNFVETVTSDSGESLEDLSDYMRPVDAVLISRSGDCLLLSEWEADEILGRIWEAGAECKMSMCSFSYLISAADCNWASPPKLMIPKRIGLDINNFRPSEHTLAALNLFAGGTMFPTPSRKAALKELLRLSGGKKAALFLPILRGCDKNVERR